MSVQRRNDELVDVLTPDFQARAEPNFAWRTIVSSTMGLPLLISVWTTGALRLNTGSSRVRDIVSQLNSLQEQGSPTYGYDDLVPYGHLNGTNQSWYRADGGAGNWADVRGNEAHVEAAFQGVSLGGWFAFDTITDPGFTALMGKGAMQAGAGGCYNLHLVDDNPAFDVSDGVNAEVVSTVTVGTTLWHCIVGTWDAGTLLGVFCDGTWTTQADGTGNLNDLATNFEVGRDPGGTAWLDGKMSICWLAQGFLSQASVNTWWHQTRAAYGR